jgi:glutamate carboxypeptidase
MQAALDALRARRHEMPALTRLWVEINSFTENVAGVNRVAERMDEAFALPSLRREVLSSDRFGDHRLWLTPAAARPEARLLLLIGHHDTVFPPGHFEGWREEGDLAFGPGALDMKGGLALVRTALAALDDAGALASMPLAVVSVSDEEIGSPDSSPHILELARRADAALVFESGRENDAIVTRRKGTGAITVIAEGRAAHAGNAHAEGRNAIWALSRFIDVAQRLTDYRRGRTVSVGLIEGGTSKNTVPAHARCSVDVRFETTADATALLDALADAAAQASREIDGTQLRIEGGASRLPLERTAASAALYAEYAACQRQVGLGDSESPLVGGGSDANTVASLGVPAIDALGPRGKGFHTTHEHIDLTSFLPKAEALLRFLWRRYPR